MTIRPRQKRRRAQKSRLFKSKAKNEKKFTFSVLIESLRIYILLSNKKNNHYILCFLIIGAKLCLGHRTK